MQPLRINFILPAPGLSGGVKAVRLIAESLVRFGHDVTIAFAVNKQPWPKPWRVRSFLKRLQLEHKSRRPGRKHHLEESTARLLPVHGVPRLEPHHVPDADVTFATWWETMEWIASWPASKGLKAYFIQHYETEAATWNKKNPEALKARIDATYRLPSVKFVVARWIQRVLAEKLGVTDTVRTPEGLDWNHFNSTPRPKNAIPTIGMMYSPVKWKGAVTALEALRIAQRERPELRVVAFGPRPLAREHAPPARFELHVRPLQKLIPELYRRCDAWLVPSTLEGFGMPGLEAAACRCPVIATRCGGPEDYVDDGETGFLVDVGDAHTMARRILDVARLDDSGWRAMSEASYAKAREFTWDGSARIMEQTLIPLVATHRP